LNHTPPPPDKDYLMWLAHILILSAAVLSIVFLGGCASRPAVTAIATPVPCRVTLPDDRTFPFDDLQPGADIFTQVKTLLADRRERIDDRRVTRAAASVCE